MNCDICGKKRKKLDFTNKNTNEKMCLKCAFKYQLNIDKNILKTTNKFINWLTFKFRHRIYDNADKIVIAFLVLYLLICVWHNVKDFDLLNLSTIVLLALVSKDEF